LGVTPLAAQPDADLAAQPAAQLLLAQRFFLFSFFVSFFYFYRAMRGESVGRTPDLS